LIDPGTYDVARLATRATPPEAIQEVLVQGYARDGTLMAILRHQIPEPQSLKDAGLTEAIFYNQIASYWTSNRKEFAPFDPAAFAAEINEKIVQPVKKAQALFTQLPRLTRLGTFISPEEMTTDPLFMANTTLPDLPVQRMAKAFVMCGNQSYTRCEAPVRLELADGQKVYYPPRPSNGGDYCYPGSLPFPVDQTAVNKAPALEVAYKRESAGEGAMRFDNRKAISDLLAANNAAVQAIKPPPQVTGFPGRSPMPNPNGVPPIGMPGEGTSSGGACAYAGAGSNVALPLVLLVVAAALRRRRPR
jgi:MYXO-CTERM domain-containing protein